jgi:hypothetical protein
MILGIRAPLGYNILLVVDVACVAPAARQYCLNADSIMYI